MADGHSSADRGYVYSSTTHSFVFPLLRDQYSSPYLDDSESEARRFDVSPQPYHPDERGLLLNNTAVARQQKASKAFRFGISNLSFLWPFSGGSCCGYGNANREDLEDLKRRIELQSSELDAMRRERDAMKQDQSQRKKMHKTELESLRAAHHKDVNLQQAQWNKSMEAAKAEAARLQKRFNHMCEADNTKSHEAMISSFSRHVSRAYTDDKIKEELKQFYQNDFLSWCGDLSSSSIREPEEAKKKLQSMGIVNSSKSYMSEPVSLQFSMDLPDDRSPVVLLQAALSQALCHTFLQDAYFLAEGIETPNGDYRRWLKKTEALFCKVDKDTGVNWRIQTVESLEKAIPFGSHLVEHKAKAFVQEFHFLLDKVNDQALQELTQLFVDFGSMTLKFWKMRTVITAHGLSRFAEYRLDADSPLIEADLVGSLAARRRLQGRRIGVLVRPLIVSEPLGQDGEASHEVVWLKAAGWVPDF